MESSIIIFLRAYFVAFLGCICGVTIVYVFSRLCKLNIMLRHGISIALILPLANAINETFIQFKHDWQLAVFAGIFAGIAIPIAELLHAFFKSK